MKSHLFADRSKTMTEEQKTKDCTDCVHFTNCYLRRHRKDISDVTPCEDIELNPWDKE